MPHALCRETLLSIFYEDSQSSSHSLPPSRSCLPAVHAPAWVPVEKNWEKEENGWEWRPFPGTVCFIGLLNYTVFGLRFIRACAATTLKCLLLKTPMNRFMGADSILSDHLDKKARVLHSRDIWDSSDLEHVEFLGRAVNCVADRYASLGRFQAKNAGMLEGLSR